MKEPWEVFVDEFLTEFARRSSRDEDGRPVLARDDVAKIYKSLHEATVFHLISQGWPTADAIRLSSQFFNALARASQLEKEEGLSHRAALREAMRHAYTDFMLKQQRGEV